MDQIFRVLRILYWLGIVSPQDRLLCTTGSSVFKTGYKEYIKSSRNTGKKP